jgi:CheY-like chemotaxis protein
MNENRHILVVEGSRTQAERLKLVLQAEGYPVTVITNGTEALAAARAQRPALILSGVAVVGTTGYDLCAALKQDVTLKNIPVVLLTALTDSEDLLQGLTAQVDYYIAKPYQESDLLSRVAAILAGPVQKIEEAGQEQLVVQLSGSRHVIASDRQQLLRLLLSTYENYSAVLRQNHALSTAQLQLRTQNQQLHEEYRRAQAALAQAPVRSSLPQTQVPFSQGEIVEHTQGARILIAEDNPVSQVLLLRFLEKLGHRADVVSDGNAAAAACEKAAYAVILMDVQLPIMHGLEAAARIRQIERATGRHTPIIAVTAHTLPGDRERCLAAGMDDYLPKPVGWEAFKTTLLRWLPTGMPASGTQVKEGGATSPTQRKSAL